MPVVKLKISPLLLTLTLAFGATTGMAQSVQLVPATKLEELVDKEALNNAALHIAGDVLQGQVNEAVKLSGSAQLRRSGTAVKADQIEYNFVTDRAIADGGVQLNHKGNVFEGSRLELKVDGFQGYFLNPTYRLAKNGATGDAARIDFLGETRTTLDKATYSTCRRVPGIEWLPDWVLNATRIEMDTEQDIGVAQGAVLHFKEVPILALPTISFPLGNGRKTGFLSPSYSTDSLSGFELTTPFYWNIAPHRDATLFPTVSAKRGVNLGVELRYLEARYAGQVRVDVMPNDRLRDESRWGLSTQHQQYMDTDVGKMGLSLGLNRVSDDNYWRDFPRATGLLAQRLLPSEAKLSWSQGEWSSGLRLSKWQTLQDISAPINPPFDRLPQWNLMYQRTNWGGLDVNFETQLTRFKADAMLTGQVNGNRAYFTSEVSRPFKSPSAFLTPKLIFNASNYQFDTPLSNGTTSARLLVPTVSLDSGLVFEREVQWSGRGFVQTLEPRAFYVYTPYRDQSLLPNYDSVERDFNFSSLFTENLYSGGSRIADGNFLTFGLSSKLFEQTTGAERVRFGIAQRFRFTTQRVTLPGGVADSSRLTDFLLAGAVHLNPVWSVEVAQQLNPTNLTSTRSTAGVRYSPAAFKVLNAAYRYQKDTHEQAEVSWQWPVAHVFGRAVADATGFDARWYSVGRLNFSITDRKLVDSVIGFEYDAGCWVGRVVVENLARSDATSNKRVLLQLDFIGFASLGSGTLKTLRTAIPRYQSLRETAEAQGRFSMVE